MWELPSSLLLSNLGYSSKSYLWKKMKGLSRGQSNASVFQCLLLASGSLPILVLHIWKYSHELGVWAPNDGAPLWQAGAPEESASKMNLVFQPVSCCEEKDDVWRRERVGEGQWFLGCFQKEQLLGWQTFWQALSCACSWKERCQERDGDA